MVGELIPLNGYVRVIAWQKKPCGEEEKIHDHTIKNLIVNVGKDSILKHIGGPTIACCTDSGFAEKIGVGDSSTAAALGDVNLLGCMVLWKTIATTDNVIPQPTWSVNNSSPKYNVQSSDSTIFAVHAPERGTSTLLIG